MDKVRIYELAKELNTNSKNLIDKLKAININVKNHMSIIEDNELAAIYDYFGIKAKRQKDDIIPKADDKLEIEENRKLPVEAKPQDIKNKKNAPRIIRTEVREIRTDANTGIITEIRTQIKGDSKREVRTNIINNKPEAQKIDKSNLFEFRNTDTRKKVYDNRNDYSKQRYNDNRVNPYNKTESDKEKVSITTEKEQVLESPDNKVGMKKAPETKVEDTIKKENKDIDERVIEKENKQEVRQDVKRDALPNNEEKKIVKNDQRDRSPFRRDNNFDRSRNPQPGMQNRTGSNNYQGNKTNTAGNYNDRSRNPQPGMQNRTGSNNYQGNKTQTAGNYNRSGVNNRPFEQRPPQNERKFKERDFIGEQLREVAKDMPKHVSQEPQKQIHRDAVVVKDKISKDVKKDTNKPVNKPLKGGKQEKNLKQTTIKTLGHEQRVSDILNDENILLEFYDSDKAKKLRKGSQGKGRRHDERQNYQPEPVRTVLKVVLPEIVTVKDLAEKLKKQASEVIKKLFAYGIMATLNQEIDYDAAATISEEYGYTVEKEIVVSEEDILFDDSEDKEEELEPRAPIVVVMGHVDHGKTSLLDAIRETNVIAKEAGGITQHIGAYSVKINNRKIAFLDTPGHEAFTAMRARGAQVTDIAILVVAADDGVMPQTIEAINHAKAANVSIIVAVNKIDKPGANPDKVKQELMEHGLVAEEWGGETICVNVSAKQREGIDSLLEMVLLVADMMNLKSNPNKQAKGTVIEAKLDKGRGPVATMLVQRGTLKVGDSIVAGTTVGRIRAMTDDKGQKVKKAKPSTPVEIIGLPDVPEAGELFYAVGDERIAKQLVEKRRIKHRELSLKSSSRVTLDDLFNQIQQGKVKDLNIIVKADVQGSVEAIKQSLEKLINEEVRVKIIHGGVGAITESDVMLANVSNAIIIGFNVRPESSARTVADRENVDIKLYRVIYEAIDDITAAMKGMLDPKFKEVILGHIEVRQIFKASGIGTIAGCHVTDGKITRNSDIRIIRNGIVVHEGKLASLKRFKDDAKEVATGFECGITLEKYNDIKEGDVIEAFTEEKIVD